MSKLLLIARMDKSGLGFQTRNLAYMLKPDRILIIDSTPFNKNDQHPEWYDSFQTNTVSGFPHAQHVKQVLKGITHVLTCEIPYNYQFFDTAGVKSFLQPNWEFFETPKFRPHPRPDHLLMPSYWHLEDANQYVPATYLPPPLFPQDFKNARQKNLNRTGKSRFLHVLGKMAAHDRNGSVQLLNALKYCKEDFELVIHSQFPMNQPVDDPRLKYRMSNLPEPQDIYEDFDAVIMPRKYGGLCLPMNEALMCGLPVLMTDISPNNKVLPKDWLVSTKEDGVLESKMPVQMHKANEVSLAKRIDWLAKISDQELVEMKTKALDLGMEYSADKLKPKYKEVMGL